MKWKPNEDSWRPQSFDEYVGQTDLLALLRDEMDASLEQNVALPHMCFSGPPGLGKTSVAELLATVREVPIHTLMGPSITEVSLCYILGELDATGYNREGYVTDRHRVRPSILFIDEADGLKSKDIWELLHRATDIQADGRRHLSAKLEGRSQRKQVWVPEFTLILATNYYGELFKMAPALLNRVPIKWSFEPYGEDDMTRLVLQYARKTGMSISDEAAQAIAQRSLGTPRTALALFRQARTRVVAATRRDGRERLDIDLTTVEEASKLMKIDEAGLPYVHRRYLEILAASGGKLGFPTLVAALNVDEKMIKVAIEPDLIRKGFVTVVPGGRQITDEGLDHVGNDRTSPLLSRRI
jgi:Holliday junction DNA helicase RuvB